MSLSIRQNLDIIPTHPFETDGDVTDVCGGLAWGINLVARDFAPIGCLKYTYVRIDGEVGDRILALLD